MRNVDEFSLLTALKPPVRCFILYVSHINNVPQLERQIFDAALQWAMKADKTHFWRGYRKFTKLESPQDSVGAIRKASTPRVKTDEYVQLGHTNERIQTTSRDENQLAKLRQLGMTSIEEMKLVSMRDYILKLANAVSRSVNSMLHCTSPNIL